MLRKILARRQDVPKEVKKQFEQAVQWDEYKAYAQIVADSVSFDPAKGTANTGIHNADFYRAGNALHAKCVEEFSGQDRQLELAGRLLTALGQNAEKQAGISGQDGGRY